MNTYLGDFLPGKTLVLEFNTFDTSGNPTALSSGSVAVYKDGSPVTPSGGVTLVASSNSVIGYNTVTVNTLTDGTTFAAGHDYSVQLAGSSTVAGTSVVGYLVGKFSLANRSVAVDSSGKVLLQATQTGVTIPTVSTVTNAVSLPSIPSNWITAAGVNAAALNGKGDWNTTTPPTVAAIATGVWQDATAGDFTAASSIGKALYVANVVPGAAGGHFIAGTNAATTITTSLTTHIVGTVDTVTTVTNQLAGSAVATAVWQDATAGDFTVPSSAGAKLASAGSAGDPWSTTLPGAYGAGTAGAILGNKIAATLNATDVTGNLPANLMTIATQTVTCTAGVTVGAYVGNATHALTVDTSGNVSIGSLAGVALYAYEGVIQSATGSPTYTVTLPTSDSAGNTIYDDTRYQYMTMGIVNNTGTGQFVRLTTRTGTRTYAYDPTSMPVLLDGTSQYVWCGSWRAQALLASGDVTGNVPANVQATASALTYNLTGNVTGNLSGSVGSVTGNVGGNVTGSVASVAGAVGSVTAPVTAGTVSDKTGYSLSPSQTWSTTGSVGSVVGNVGGNVVGSVASVTAPVTAGTVSDKTGYSLGATGLALLSTADVSGVATSFVDRMNQLWQKEYRHVTKSTSTGNIVVFAANGTTPLTTQAWTDAGDGNQTIGAAS
jgi:hypothetical protein